MKIINKPSRKSNLFPCFEKAAKLLADAGASSVSYIPTDQCRILRPYLLPKYAAGALIFTVPYLCEDALSHRERNLSLYAVPRDYHIFFKELFDSIENILNAEFPSIEVRGFSDHSPIDEVHAAALAGLGVIGDNKLLITEEYGSYVFIGELYLSKKSKASDASEILSDADSGQNLSEPEKNIRYGSSKAAIIFYRKMIKARTAGSNHRFRSDTLRPSCFRVKIIFLLCLHASTAAHARQAVRHRRSAFPH